MFKKGITVGALILCSITIFAIRFVGHAKVQNQETVKSNFSQNDFDEYQDNLDEHIANSFNISLDEYEKVNFSDLEKKNIEFEFIQLYFGIPKEVGDKQPSIYFKNEAERIIIMQKSDGTNKIYYLKLDDNGWFIESEDAVKGKVMNFGFE